MQPLTIELELDGEKKRYVTPSYIGGLHFRLAATISQEFEDQSFNVYLNLDKYLQFVVDVFDRQFDVNTLEKGMDSRKIINTIYSVANYVLGNIDFAIKLLSDKEPKEEELGK
ncbi:hypothetical protein CHR37_06350 [Bacillus velezensis]|uniref:phage tail assembly chaperone G n=1 Tax=Bacillus velezensis TaxID=492670 RepID=UPI000B93C11B|nr:hypothetical protein [Bacillus velezensis]OYD12559.1 hypothetical protein CHR37_06350 [Bacillus velezensis]PAK28389.1 hypothetical protein CJ467_20875 [Bacillus velezensis]